MSYALYQKYRPQNFDEVYGQDHVVSVLKKSITQGNFSHAYLFEGPRGTGKTSVARIFGKEIGCSPEDIIEIDAASHRRVEDVRSLRDSVHSLPFRGKYKLYIIDEVHMFTTESFNTLLKTLEEPPKHVVFILATTESHKIPDTIRSRCQVFQFLPPNIKVLRDMIEHIARKEGYLLETGVAEMIAFIGNASFRDTQMLLQKVFSYKDEKKEITHDDLSKVFGIPQQKILNEFILALAKKDREEIFTILQKMRESSFHADIFLRMILERIRFILQLRFSSSNYERLKTLYGEDFLNFHLKIAREKNGIRASLLENFLSKMEYFSFSYDPYLVIELAIFSIFDDNTAREGH